VSRLQPTPLVFRRRALSVFGIYLDFQFCHTKLCRAQFL
jgi:hypothetical protein